MSGPTMWPAVLPAHVRGDRHRQAEVKVYDRLKEALDSSWTVFYSRPWLGLTPTGAERDGECDFVVVHPKHGFLAVEVKGGGISYDPSTDAWMSRDRDGIRHRINNPVDQARKAKHGLLDRLKHQPEWPARRFIRARHGVVFPDAESPPGNLGADRPRELFCCYPDMPRIDQWILSRLIGGTEDDLGRDGVRAFERLLAAPFLLRVPLGHVLDEDERAIAVLTPEQFHILDSVSLNTRVAVGGGAGTGKTIVAIEDALRMAESGSRTLLTCLSTQLAAEISKRLAGAGVTVLSFPELCTEFTRRAGLGGSSFSADHSPEQLMRAVALNPGLKFDAVIVDEAQDFRTHWWIAIEALLKDPATSQLHVFYDTNQSLYGNISGELSGFSMVPVHLGRNLRNTRTIHGAAARFYRGLPVRADGPQGVSIEWLRCKTTDLPRITADAVRRLVRKEAVRPEDVTILAVDGDTIRQIRIQLSGLVDEGVTTETIAQFKGLEQRVVVLAATPELADQPELAYVALSRARAHLVIAGDPNILAWLGAQS